MEDLITATYDKLKMIDTKVVDQRPPVDTAYPFIQYSINEPTTRISPSIYTLTIDIWTKSKSYLEVERLASKVNKEFRDDVMSARDVEVKLKKSSEIRVEDEDVSIKRKRIVYQMRAFNY